MSSTVVSFIPVDPSWRIADGAALDAERYLTNYYAGSTEIQINRSYTRPFFIDAGGNHEDTRCPKCGKGIPVTAWQDAMNGCWIDTDRGFDLSADTVRCCNTEFTPDQLVYVPEQGFAMVSLEVTEPTCADHAAANAQLTSLLNTPMRIVIARY